MPEIMGYLYEHLDLLMYLRFNPRWYKILYYDKSYFNTFLKEAKEKMGLRTIDKLNNFKNQFNLLSGFAKYMNSWYNLLNGGFIWV